MALIKCEVCGKDISDQATKCPHCGNPSLHHKRKRAIWIGILIAVVVVIFCVFSIKNEMEELDAKKIASWGDLIPQ